MLVSPTHKPCCSLCMQGIHIAITPFLFSCKTFKLLYLCACRGQMHVYNNIRSITDPSLKEIECESIIHILVKERD